MWRRQCAENGGRLLEVENSMSTSGFRKARNLGEPWLYVSTRNPDVTWKSYNPETGQWMRLPSFVGHTHERYGTVAMGSKLFVIGGCDSNCGEASNQVCIYDSVTSSWSEGPPMKKKRSNFAHGMLDEHVFVAGDESLLSDVQSASAEMLDVSRGQWEVLPPTSALVKQLDEMLFLMPARRHFFGIAFGDYFVVRSSHATWQMTYNTASGLWTRDPCSNGGEPMVMLDENFYCFNGSALSISEDLKSWKTVSEVAGPRLLKPHLVALQNKVAAVGMRSSVPHECIALFWSPSVGEWSAPLPLDSSQTEDGGVDGCSVITL